MNFHISFKIILFIPFVIANRGDFQCSVPGECITVQHLTAISSLSQNQCLEQCQSDPDCKWFTYFPEGKTCHLFASCDSLDEEICQDCISGQAECSGVKLSCWVHGKCLGNILHTVNEIR